MDSANYAVQNISPEQVMSYLFTFDKDSTLKRNKMLMGLVTNKLLLAFKNKPGFLETLVLDCTPSLLNILLRLVKMVAKLLLIIDCLRTISAYYFCYDS